MIKNLLTEFENINDYWSPKVIAEVNDSYMKIAKTKGTFVWHTHDNEDELFYVVKGTFTVQYKDSIKILKENDMHVVPKGIEHCPKADDEAWIMLIEKKTTKHTGTTVSHLTKTVEDQI